MILVTYHIRNLFMVLFGVLALSTPAFSHAITDSISVIDSQDLSSRESNICDSVDHQTTKFKPQQLIVPGALMVSGLVGVIYNDNNLNRSVHDAMTDLSNGKQCKIDDYLRFVPSAAHLIIGSIGIKSKHNFKERFLISATAHAAMLVIGYGAKYIINEQRPDLSDKHSFPSGHVAMAFTGAELLRSEYGTAYGIGGYAIATGIAFLRLYNNRHWFNDVLMGAGIGILSARIGNWLFPFNRKLFKINKNSSKTSTIAIMPSYNVIDKTYMMSLNAIF